MSTQSPLTRTAPLGSGTARQCLQWGAMSSGGGSPTIVVQFMADEPGEQQLSYAAKYTGRMTSAGSFLSPKSQARASARRHSAARPSPIHPQPAAAGLREDDGAAPCTQAGAATGQYLEETSEEAQWRQRLEGETSSQRRYCHSQHKNTIQEPPGGRA